MDIRTSNDPRPGRPLTPPAGLRERLAFNYGPGVVPARSVVEAAIAAGTEPTFATAEYAEPRDWGYLGLLAFTAVLLLRPQDSIPGLSSLHMAEICAFIGIGPMVLHRFAQRLPVFRITPETIGLFLFGLVIVGTAPFSVWPGGALAEFTDSYLKVIVVFVLMMNTLTTPKRIERLTWVILLCIGAIAARGVFDYARGVNLVEGGRLAGPVSGMFGNPNDLALNMVTFMPAALVLAMSRRQPPVRRAIAAFITALMLATVVFTKSRGGMLGLVAMLLTLFALGGTIRRGFGMFVLGAVLVATPFMPSSFWTRMTSIVDEQEDAKQFTGSREARRVVMEEGIDTFVEFPLTGVGAGQFKNYNPPERKERWHETHNALIQVAAETGVFGLLAFSFLVFRAGVGAFALRRMLRGPTRRGERNPLDAVLSTDDRVSLHAHTVAMVAGLVGWFTCAFFASVAYSWTFYYLLALIVAARELTHDRLLAARALQKGKLIAVPTAARMSGRVAPGIA